MIPVDQQEIDLKGYGDCMRACLASLLELPLSKVPHLRKLQTEGKPWFPAFFKFLKAHGYEYVGSFEPYYVCCNRLGPDFGKPVVYNWADLDTRCPGVKGFYMAGGPSPRGAVGGHAVIVDGLGGLQHDPHPSRAGVPRIDNIYMIEPIREPT